MDLAGKTAIVTGSAKRVGRVIARFLAERGTNIVVHYNTSEADAREAVDELTGMGVHAEPMQADLTRADQVTAMVDGAVEAFGGVQILVNSAAVFPRTPFRELTEADWDRSIDANLKGPFLCAWRVGLHLLASGGGKIVNIADWAGEMPYADYLPYCVSKAGVIGLTKALAVDLAPTVTVNAVSPGPVLLPEDFSQHEKQEVARQTAVKRIGSPEDIAATVRFLLEGSDFITGQVLKVDGGRSLCIR